MGDHRELSIHQTHELLLRFEQAGFTAGDAQRVIESKNNALAREVVSLIRGIDDSTRLEPLEKILLRLRRARSIAEVEASHYELQEFLGDATGGRAVTRARAVLGQNFFGRADCQAFYDAQLIGGLPVFPWSEDVLNGPCPFYKGKRIAETHFAFLGLDRLNGQPLTIMKWHELHPTGQPRFYANNPWYGDERFAIDVTCEFRWYLMPLDIVPGSERKTYQQQFAMLPEEYEVPSAVAEVTKNLLVFRKTGRYPNPNRWARCADVTSRGDRVSVGFGGENGLDVNDLWDGYRRDYVGLAASSKL